MKKRIDNIDLLIPPTVYDPAEDSFLLAENVKIISPDSKVLEIGSGSGFVSIYLAKKYPNAEFFCVDINFSACSTTKLNAQNNDCALTVCNSNLFTALNKAMNFDVILFNSPYLPVTDSGILGKAWSGGQDGLLVIREFLSQLLPHLNGSSSVCYLVVSTATNLTILHNLMETKGYQYQILDEIKEGRETILLYKITNCLS